MLKSIDNATLLALCQKARASTRKRAHYNIHDSAEDAVQRLLIALQPGTFVPVHRHSLAGRWELLTLLSGSLDCVLFDDTAQIIGRQRFHPGQARAIEFSPGTWHTVVCLEEDTIIQEIKPGPYDPATASEIAPWCPEESHPHASQFYQWIVSSSVGDRFINRN